MGGPGMVVSPQMGGAGPPGGVGLPGGMMPPKAPGMGMGMAPPAPPGGNSQRIDPAQIPRPPHDPHSEVVQYDSRSQQGSAVHPPAATSSFVAKDLGSCSPRYMRSTMSTIPNSGDLLSSSGMPLTIIVQPLAMPHPEEEPIQVVDNGDVGPVRCGRCKAYMNPFMRFLDHTRFQCNFCTHVTECPREYMCNLGGDGRRRDWMERPELCRGSVEYNAPKEYMVRPPMSPALFFCIDVSTAAIASGATTSACEAIVRTLDSVPQPQRTLVGLCTFDSTIHFYAVRPGASQPHMLVVPDVDEPYSPLPSGLVVPLEANREAIDSVLKQIPEMFASNRHGAPVGTAAIKACIEALKPIGGRVLAFMGSMPTGGYGALKPRGGTGGGGGINKGGSGSEVDKEPVKYLAPADKLYSKMATEAAEYQVAVDLFLLSTGFTDVASLGVLPRTTGGTLYRYPNFDTQLDFAQLHNDLRWNLLRPQGLEAVMRLRASAGLGVVDYGGFYCKRTPTDVDLPTLDSDKAISVSLRYEEKLPDGQEACVQCALLYTTVAGERRIRVHTLALPISSVLGNIFRASDLEAQTCDMIRRASARLLTGTCSLIHAKEQALTTTVSTLYSYRKFCASNNSTGQLILPEGLKVLPLYCLALHKSPGLRADASPDDRASWLLQGLCSTAYSAVPSIYPRNFPVHQIPDDPVFPPLPTTTWLSSEKLEPDGMYLLEDGRDVHIWVGRQVPADHLKACFGVENVDQIQSATFALPQLDTPQSKALNAFMNCMRKMRSSYMHTRILKRGDQAEHTFYARLIEDRSAAGIHPRP